jgi:uncharacterized protein (DUF1697 family)
VGRSVILLRGVNLATTRNWRTVEKLLALTEE